VIDVIGGEQRGKRINIVCAQGAGERGDHRILAARLRSRFGG
jgi:hypothetical protein